jgi:hypothetical protein
MAGNYTVKQGDHISSIAKQNGFLEYETIWNHPNNAALKQLRGNPNILFPGDTVFVPDKELRVEDGATEVRHKFKLHDEKLNLRLVLNRFYGPPFAATECTLRIGTTQSDLTSDGNGQVEHEIPKTAVDASVTVKDTITVQDTTVPADREIKVKIGFLDPVTEVSGQQGRLSNLGYYRASGDALDNDEFLSAVEEFQCENNLTVDGKCGPMTQAKLKTVHGC